MENNYTLKIIARGLFLMTWLYLKYPAPEPFANVLNG
jgi:hypothetical protein